jgi:predicted TIM-barrel enzyme
MARPQRLDLLAKYRAMIAAGEPIVGGGAGTGLSAKCEEAGGIDLIVIYNSGRYRMAGRGSLAGLLAYGNANEIVVEMAKEVLPVVKHTPVLAGVNGTDPFMIRDKFLQELKDLGFAGVQNFPTVAATHAGSSRTRTLLPSLARNPKSILCNEDYRHRSLSRSGGWILGHCC